MLDDTYINKHKFNKQWLIDIDNTYDPILSECLLDDDLKKILKILWIKKSEINNPVRNKLNKEDFEILLKLKEYWVNISVENIPVLLSTFTKEVMDCFVNTYDRENYKNIINIFIKNCKKKCIRDYIERKNEYLEKNRTLSDEKFIELFNSTPHKKAEINQQSLPLCYMYAAIEALKKTNAFDALVKTNIRECDDNSWEVRLPFSEKTWVWVKVFREEMENNSLTSNTSKWFKILEIACLKRKWLEKKWTCKNWNIKINEQIMQWLKNGWYPADIHRLFIPSINIISSTDWWLPDLFKELAFDNYKSGAMMISLIKREGEERNDVTIIWNDTQDILSYGSEFRNYNWYMYSYPCAYTKYQDIKYFQYPNWYWCPHVQFCWYHAYSIEKCYEKNGEKRVQIVNPRHTWIKYDMSFEACKSMFDREISVFDISKMFINK